MPSTASGMAALGMATNFDAMAQKLEYCASRRFPVCSSS
jgi:hypothetical protein